MKNSQRYLVRYLHEFSAKNGISVTEMSDQWIFLLEKNGFSHIVFGYDLGLNSSTTHRVANDKAATYDILSANGVPAVEHYVFLHPRYAKHLSTDGNWPAILEKFETWARDAVIKPNEGTGGISVFRVQTNFELELAVHTILASERSVAVSPFFKIEREIRVFLLNEEAIIVYEKNIPSVKGDGTSTIIQLMLEQLNEDTISAIIEDKKQGGAAINLQEVPPANVDVSIHWKHNLGQGSKPRFLELSNATAEIALAKDAARSIGLRFGTVDLIQTGRELRVLEVNSGVMMEGIAKHLVSGTQLLDTVYGSALSTIFAENMSGAR